MAQSHAGYQRDLDESDAPTREGGAGGFGPDEFDAGGVGADGLDEGIAGVTELLLLVGWPSTWTIWAPNKSNMLA